MNEWSSSLMTTGTVTSVGLNVHKDALASSLVIDQLKMSDRVDIVNRTAATHWLFVKTPTGRFGYVDSKFVKIDPDPPATKMPVPVDYSDPSPLGADEHQSSPPSLESAKVDWLILGGAFLAVAAVSVAISHFLL